ncbi:hypothetical protein AWZ03_004083 [Drosophila navojoa]|uniref:Uncharacterized protein n=1 Tax=Drosophila navojoa TaxID=7232 RepID=A0A484BN27_DRONA|nr:hypothetical protein AWZ03_004083 [Drosophila navojoa]
MLWRHIGIVCRFAEGNQNNNSNNNNNNSENSSGNNNKYRIRISSEKRPLNHAATAVVTAAAVCDRLIHSASSCCALALAMRTDALSSADGDRWQTGEYLNVYHGVPSRGGDEAHALMDLNYM